MLISIFQLKSENKKYEYLADYIPVEKGKALTLRAKLEGTRVQFYFEPEGEGEREIGPEIKAGFLSDEACEEGWFTGAMCGICCQDLTGFGKYADFDWFEVK